MSNSLPSDTTTPDGGESLWIEPERLLPGVFVCIDLGWTEHPFVFNRFRITSTTQIEQIRALGLPRVRWIPARSTTDPRKPPESMATSAPRPTPAAEGNTQAEATSALRPDTVTNTATTSAPAPDAPIADVGQGAPPAATAPSATPGLAESAPPEHADKSARARRLDAQRARIQACEKAYTATASRIRNLMHDLHADTDRAVGSARELVGSIVDGFAAEGEIVIHLMNEKIADESPYFHVLNVMLLSLLLGRELSLPPELLRILGEGALFHDIGKQRIPDMVLRNPHRNRHEEEFFRLHTVYGRELARELGGISAPARDIIEFHHEMVDGKGYPKGLKGGDIPALARVVAIANRYDNLCNPPSGIDAMTPATALTRMFRDEANAWDAAMLKRFIRLLGVYPPGSLVQLSNGNIALVITVNHADLLRPSVMVYDPDTPKEKALVVDLVDEPEVSIDFVMKATELDKPAQQYLAPRRRMSYYHASSR